MKIDQTPFEALLLKTKVKFRANMQGWRAQLGNEPAGKDHFGPFGEGVVRGLSFGQTLSWEGI